MTTGDPIKGRLFLKDTLATFGKIVKLLVSPKISRKLGEIIKDSEDYEKRQVLKEYFR